MKFPGGVRREAGLEPAARRALGPDKELSPLLLGQAGSRSTAHLGVTLHSMSGVNFHAESRILTRLILKPCSPRSRSCGEP